MNSTYLLRCQHSDAMAMIVRLLRLLDHCGGADHANLIMQQLAKLTQLMRVHFAQEDHCLYPQLIASPDPDVADAAKAFQREMGELWEQYESFARSWSTATAIIMLSTNSRANASRFSARSRIAARENDFLFPLAETGKRPPLAA